MRKLTLLILCMFAASPLWGQIGIQGCYHFDHFGKKHFVSCLCNCTTTHPTCIWCGHYHEAKDRLEIVKQSAKAIKQKVQFSVLTMEQAFTNLISHYKNKTVLQ